MDQVRKMQAILFRRKDEGLIVTEVPVPEPRAGEMRIRLKFASLNHLDLWIWDEQSLEAPVISGSDGSGIVDAVGAGVDNKWIGREVVINPSLNWGVDENVFQDTFEILGNPTNGTFAQYICIPQQYVHIKPNHLSLKESAALPLAALTAYRALFTKAAVKKSEKALITGIGGGAALYLMQMAIASGATVSVTSSSDEKLHKAVSLGAEAGYNYINPAWTEHAMLTSGGFDVIIDSAAGNGFAQLTEVAKAGARIVLFGRTAGNINNLQPGIIYNKQLQIMGTVMGTEKEFHKMLRYYEEHQLRPIIDREFSLPDIEQARQYMKSGTQFGKIILQIP